MNSTFESYEDVLGAVTIDISDSDAKVLVRPLGVAYGLAGEDAKSLKYW